MTALRQIADKCAFGAITPDDLLRDRIIFGIADNKVRERLLREPEFNLSKTLDICRASEMSQAQIKTVSEFNSSNVHLIQENKKASGEKLSGGQPSPTNFSVVGSTKVNARLALLGASSVSSAAKRTILPGNAPCLPSPTKWHCLRRRVSCLFSKFSKYQSCDTGSTEWKLYTFRN